MSAIPVEPVDHSEDPWERFGWLMGAIWLVFFGFPLYTVWTSEHALSWRVGVTAVVLAFMVVYVVALRRPGPVSDAWEPLAFLTALLVLAGVLGATVGPEALTAMPFLVSYPIFTLSWRAAIIASSVVFLISVVSSTVLWGAGDAIWMWGVSLLVVAMGVVIRTIDARQSEHHALSSRLGLSQERERVARDVHDVLGHSLTVVTIKAELAERLIDTDPQRAKAELAEVQSLSRQALAEIRATVGGLRVARLAEELEAARMALRGAGIEPDLPDDPSVVDPRHRITVAWVMREAVTNVVRHSRASRCHVDLGSDCLIVTDDGTGTRGRSEGNGLRGLRERVGSAGGTLTIGPGPGGTGTRLEVRL